MAKPPAHEFRMGLLKANIWENQTKHGTTSTVNVIRLFKNGTEWKESTRFGRDDLLTLAKLLDQAHSWIFDKQSA